MGNVDQIIAEGRQLLELIPQSPPMVMIDKLITSEAKLSVTQLTIREDNIFLENNRFSEPGLIENIAQTAAAGTGYQHVSRNEPIPIGFIGAVQKLIIHELPPIGAVLDTKVIETHSVINVTMINGTVFLNQREIARCEMKLFLQKQV
jgi:predicted hotdog family 3-hydroxylacyl-ACP dehydratase